MPQKPTVVVSSLADQRGQRFVDTFYDSHIRLPKFPGGRPWSGHRQHAAMPGHPAGFVSDMMPCVNHEGNSAATDATRWDAPFMPEVRFFDFDYNRKTIRIRYDRMFAEDVAAIDRYYEAAALVAQQTQTEAPELGAMPKFGITAIIGKPPRSPKVAQALMAGEPWILGQSDDVNEELALLLGMTRGGYRAQMLREQYGTPRVTPEAVLSVKNDKAELAAMIASIVAATLDARAEERKLTRATRTAPARAAKKAKMFRRNLPDPLPVGAAE